MPPKSAPTGGGPPLGGPGSTETLIRESAQSKKSLFDWPWWESTHEEWTALKGDLKKTTGLRFGVTYAAVWQGATVSQGENTAAGGRFQFLSQWTPFASRPGASGGLALKLENRHRLGTDVSPAGLGRELGAAVPTTYAFSDFGWGVMELNWKQPLAGGRFGFAIGRVQPITYLDNYLLVSSMSGFLNQSFSYNPTIALPQSGLGLAGGGMISDHWVFYGESE